MNPIIHELFNKFRFLSNEANLTLKTHGLYTSQWSVLNCIKVHEEMSLTQIWKYLNVEAPTITRTINRLEELGWIEVFSGKDRREKIVRLSERALRDFPDIKASMTDFEEGINSNITSEEAIILIEILKKIK